MEKESERTMGQEVSINTEDTKAQRDKWLTFLIDLIVKPRPVGRFYLYP
jgi:hypothetical protein